MDARHVVLEHTSIGVTDDRITSVGAVVASRRTIDARGAIVLPGLVNAHTHLAMTMFRGLADDLDLEHFLARLLPAEDAVLTSETVAAGTALAVAECLRAGITTALDMYFFPEAARAVARAAGFDLRDGPVFVEAAGPDRRSFDARLTWATDLLLATPADRRWVAPHSTYLLSEDQLRAVADACCRARRPRPRPRLRDHGRAGRGAGPPRAHPDRGAARHRPARTRHRPRPRRPPHAGRHRRSLPQPGRR